jgi:hypothetical protein
MTDDQLRSIIHFATNEALPRAHGMAGARNRARIQVKVADFVIGAIRAREAGGPGFGGMFFHE